MSRWAFLTSFGAWLAGIIVLWLATPTAPREWQLPGDEGLLGFLDDGRTLVTTPRKVTGERPSNLLRLWDVEKGALLASYASEVELSRSSWIERCDLLQVEQMKSGYFRGAPPFLPTRHGPNHFRLSLVDARTGRLVKSFEFESRSDSVWWKLTSDGQISSFDVYDGERSRAIWSDNVSGRQLRELPGCQQPTCFSPDGQWFAACGDGQIVVCDVPGGKEIARLSSPPGNAAWPIAFSDDGTLLLDYHGNVWDIATRTRRFAVPGPGSVPGPGCFFTPDRRGIIALVSGLTGTWLAYYDTASGKENLERRLSLFAAPEPEMYLAPITSDRRLVVVAGTYTRPPTALELKLSGLPFLRDWSESRKINTYAVIDTATNREIAHGHSAYCFSSPDGRYLFTRGREPLSGAGAPFDVWDIPPRRSWRFFAMAAAVWSCLAATLSYWYVRRRTRPLEASV
jgi:WD40 repeat protein